ncbi:MAG: DUF2933 domain-containing protein [Roseateles sp.]|uniref:DUF2933 domain-containing protein n=1 Tax=Roseateles sp. TaxID=1971397 RepID=UPI004035DEA1
MNDLVATPSRWRSPLGAFMLVAGAVGLYYLLTEHVAHFRQALPFLFLLACPLMHLFHGHGHDGHHGHGQGKSGAQPEDGSER